MPFLRHAHCAYAVAAAGIRTPETKGSVTASSLTNGVLGPSLSVLPSIQKPAATLSWLLHMNWGTKQLRGCGRRREGDGKGDGEGEGGEQGLGGAVCNALREHAAGVSPDAM